MLDHQVAGQVLRLLRHGRGMGGGGGGGGGEGGGGVIGGGSSGGGRRGVGVSVAAYEVHLGKVF